MSVTSRSAIALCLAMTVAVLTSEPTFAQTSAADHTSMPSDAELSAKHALIGRIDIYVDDVFEENEHLSAPYRLVNTLHINSHQSTIAAKLLFHSGDEFDRRKLDESERILREQRYLNAAHIAPIVYHEETNTVDLLVRVHDVWTLSPGISYGRKGGVNSASIELEENNLFGYGKRVELGYSHDVDRNSMHLRYFDPSLLGSWWTMTAAYATSTDGDEKVFDIGRPFYSLDTRWAFDAYQFDTTLKVPRYSLGEIVEEFSMHRRFLDWNGGISEGLKNNWVRRYLAGIHYDAKEFSPFQNQPASLPDDRTVAYPWIGIEILEDDYLKTSNLDQIGRTEDIHFGWSTRAELGYSAPALGSTESGPILKGRISYGSALTERQYWFNDIGLEGRLEQSVWNNAIATLDSRYYFRKSLRNVFYAAVAATATSHLDEETQLTLGGDNGLRGYPLRYQAGTARGLFTVEERFYTNWQPLKLFTVGGAVFADAGRVWGFDEFGGQQFGWLKDVGIGLRLGNARSALGNVLHIDLAFPLDGGSDISKMQVVVETKRSF